MALDLQVSIYGTSTCDVMKMCIPQNHDRVLGSLNVTTIEETKRVGAAGRAVANSGPTGPWGLKTIAGTHSSTGDSP